jgi:hypothetical protein
MEGNRRPEKAPPQLPGKKKEPAQDMAEQFFKGDYRTSALTAATCLMLMLAGGAAAVVVILRRRDVH